MQPHPWYDYDPTSREIPMSVTHLRIGLQQQQQQQQGISTTLIVVHDYTFFRNPNLQQVQIYLPAVSSIGDEAFFCCQQLEQVEFVRKLPGEEEQDDENIPQSQLVSIQNNVFACCTNLQNLIGFEHAKESLEHVGVGAFHTCPLLANVDFLVSLAKLQYLGEAAFCGSSTLTTVDLSKAVNLTILQDATFTKCVALAVILLPPNLVRIGRWAFSECPALEQITFPSSLASIGKMAFQSCIKLKSIILPLSLKHTGWRSFNHCGKLSRVVLPSSRMPFLKQHPFNAACASLSSLELPKPVPCQQWPLILEQFSKAEGIASDDGNILATKNCNSIVWNFLCQNMAQLFVMSRGRHL